jgi:chemotaxis protein histidine kinase CheA
MANDRKAEIFMPPNTLKAKVGSRSGVAAINPDILKRAEKAMDVLRQDFSDMLAADLEALTRTYADFASAQTPPNAGALFRAALDLKGQAATFEYPLIARVAASLARLMDGLQTWESAPLPLVTAHIDAIRVIYRERIKDASNLMALTLTEELEGRVVKALEQASYKP